jgi:hypothetical protein
VAAKLARVGTWLVVLALLGCDAQRPEVDQIAQRSLIGLSKKKILACLGTPVKRIAIGLEEIWTFPIGEMRADAPPWALDPNLQVSPFGSTRRCDVKVVIDKFGVSQVYYSADDGGVMPLGQQCIFAVERCRGR